MTRRAVATTAAAGLVAIAAIVIALGAARRATTATASDHASTAPAVSLATVRFGTLVTHVYAQGRVGAPAGGDAKLSFAGSGILARVDVHVGQSVVAGEPLAELDPSGLLIDAAQAREDAAAAAALYGGGSVPAQALASARQRFAAARDRYGVLLRGSGTAQSDATGAQDTLWQAEAKVAADRQALHRERTLFAGGVAAQKDVDAARQQLTVDEVEADAARAKLVSATSGVGDAIAQTRAEVAQAESELRTAQAQTIVSAAQAGSARARYEAAQRNLANAVLHAPADGVVVAILKHPGETVDPTQPAIIVGPPSSNEITVTVSGDATREIRPGALASIAVTARNIHARATVASVVPSVDPATQTSTVLLSGVPGGAASGDAVDATIETGARRGILIPTDAIVEDPQTGRAIVFVRQNGTGGDPSFVSREIETGDDDGATTLVTSGLRSGERIAAHGAFDLLAPAGG
jgi:RND family efflux transporter MFP subunit